MPKTKHPDFITHLLELYRPMRGVSARRMFGGFGFFKEGLMFALVANDELFLKVDDANRAAFEERELGKFTYEKKGKEAALSYYQAPAECLDESHLLVEWSMKSFDVALHAVKIRRK